MVRSDPKLGNWESGRKPVLWGLWMEHLRGVKNPPKGQRPGRAARGFPAGGVSRAPSSLTQGTLGTEAEGVEMVLLRAVAGQHFSQCLVRWEVVVDTKRTVELRLLRPPLQLLKPPSVGSGQGTLGAQTSPTSTEPPREPAPSRSPPPTTRAPPTLELQKPLDRMLLLLPLPEMMTPPRQRLELLYRDSGPHTRPPRELLTAAEGRNPQRGCLTLHARRGQTEVAWAPGVPTIYVVNTHFSVLLPG